MRTDIPPVRDDGYLPVGLYNATLYIDAVVLLPPNFRQLVSGGTDAALELDQNR